MSPELRHGMGRCSIAATVVVVALCVLAQGCDSPLGCVGDQCQQSCFAPPCGAGADAASATMDAGTDGSDGDAALAETDAGPAPASGATVERLGLRIAGAQVSDQPMPSATTTGFEPGVTAVTTSVDGDALVLQIDVAAIYATSVVHLEIDGVHYVVPVVLPSGGSSFLEFELARDACDWLDGLTAGCYPGCFAVCSAPESCNVAFDNLVTSVDDAVLQCLEACANAVAYLRSCADPGVCDASYGQYADEILEHFGSPDGYVASLPSDRLEGFQCDYLAAHEPASDYDLGFMLSLQCFEPQGTVGAVAEYEYWQCALQGGAPASSANVPVTDERVSVRFVPQDWNALLANTGLQPLNIAIESRNASDTPYVSNLAPGTLEICNNTGVLPGCL